MCYLLRFFPGRDYSNTMNFKELESEQKLRGGYYTPQPIAELLSHWALAGGARSVLEPACGDGSFLRAIYRDILQKAESAERTESAAPALRTIDAVEIAPEEAARASALSARLCDIGIDTQVVNQDIFSWLGNNHKQWDAIIGNPPYIRYQYFEKEQRAIAEAIFKEARVPFSKRTNAWVPIVITSVMHLAPGGRLAMVIPAELLHIQHAGGLRSLLEQEMESIILLNIREMVFPDVLQGIVLLLAVKRSDRAFRSLALENAALPTKEAKIQIIEVDDVSSLGQIDLERIGTGTCKGICNTGGDWMLGLLTDEEISLLNRLRKHPDVQPFAVIAQVDIGIVTGANAFFVVNERTLKRYDLAAIATPMLAKSDLIKGISYTRRDHEDNAQAGKAVYFLHFPAKSLSDLPSSMVDYLRSGEEQQLHTRYKCRIRDPWYVVPYVWISEVALLKRCHLFPRLVLNELGAHSTDTAYRIQMAPGYAERARDLTFSFLNSLTFLCAELEGRHYGGGVLELVPSEIEKLLIPLRPTTEEEFACADALIRSGATLDELLDFTDPLILGEGLQLDEAEIAVLRAAHRRLLRRRLRR
jgi:adenine-specific DNA-methyltransferase